MSEELLRQILFEVRELRKERQAPVGFAWSQLLQLPDHIRKTLIVVAQLGPSTANDIASYTHRARAVESAYCNTLVTMSYLKKERKGRRVYFMTEVKDNVQR